MSEYATPTNTTNPVLNPVTYWRVSAFLLLAVAILGTILSAIGQGDLLAFGMDPGFLMFTWTHNAVHWVLAGVAFLFGFANLSGNVVKTFAIVVGAVYLGLGVLGFFVENPLGDSMALHLGLGVNLVHILLGAWGLTSGLAARY